MQNKLNVFDFDGTLFRSPTDCPKNREKFEKATGMPWIIDKELSRSLTVKHNRFVPIRRGWWGRAETLEHPLVPSPAPKEWFIDEAVQALEASKKDKNAITIIMTGRHQGLKHQVLRILHEGDVITINKNVAKSGEVFYDPIDSVLVYFLGMNGPVPETPNKPNETFPWKIWIMEQFVNAYNLETIEIWEDRVEHIEKFSELDGLLAKKVIVNAVVG